MSTSTSIEYSETTRSGQSKVHRYGWSDPGPTGRFMLLDKSVIRVPGEYQRDLNEAKVTDITKGFLWASMGALVIVYRDGEYFVVDGQHRWRATLRRGDVKLVPCMVFEFGDLSDEAVTFLKLNTNRRPLTSIERHKAEVQAGVPIAAIVEAALARLGLQIAKTAKRAGQIKCLGICKKYAADDQERFERTLAMAARLSAIDQQPIAEILIKGLYYLDKNLPDGLRSERLSARLEQTGANALITAAFRFAQATGNSSEKMVATGMLQAINKGLHKRFTFVGDDQS